MSANLKGWFDLSKSISREDLNDAIAQMAFYAVKEGLDPECKEARQQYQEMRDAVKQHNLELKRAAA